MLSATLKVISIVFGINGNISESFRQYLRNIPGRRISKNYRKRPHRALHTRVARHYTKFVMENNTPCQHVPYFANTE
jgi:hypothetical protein